MTVEELHDALTLLPADLVAEADKRRSRKPRVVLWHRWAAMAACLTLILSCGILYRQGKMRRPESCNQAPVAYDAEAAPAEAAPQTPNQALPEVAQGDFSRQKAPEAVESESSVRTGTTGSGTVAPGILDIQWVQTPLKDSAAVNVSEEPQVTLISSGEKLEGYLTGRAYENVEALQEATGAFDEGWFSAHDLMMIRLACSADAAVTDIQEKEGRWEIYVTENSPESLAGEYHILITVEKGLIGSADEVTPFYALP